MNRLSWHHGLIATALAGAALILLSTSGGVGVSNNAVTYLTAARHIASGDGLLSLHPSGLLEPLAHYPPLYPLLISLPALAGLEPEVAARWLNALVFAGNIFLIGWLIRAAGGSVPRALAGSFLFLLALASLESHAFALSEPSTLLLGLAGIAVMSRFLAREGSRVLPWAALLFSMTVMVRYAGTAFVAGGMAALWIHRGRRRRRILGESLILGLITGLPFGLWLLRNWVLADTVVNRSLAFHPPGWTRLSQAAGTVGGWFLPLGAPAWAKGAVAAGSVAGFLALWLASRWNRPPGEPESARALRTLLGGCLLGYLGLLMVSLSSLDAATPLDRRILSPVFALSLILVLGAFRLRPHWAPRGPSPIAARAGRAVFWSAILLLCLFYGMRGGRWVMVSQREGLGYASRDWQASEVMERIRALERGRPVYTNGIEAVYYLTGRRPRELPAKYNRYTTAPNDRYLEELVGMHGKLAANGGVVAHFETVTKRNLPSVSELSSILDPEPVVRDRFGALYRAAGSAGDRDGPGLPGSRGEDVEPLPG